MSENPSEYLKRTCLICGCHTNQTINIYEPRSGPNIVQLIQAKFKFQPLNEDKYLCFSCNNWLINWHSLQALNSNDAESPSGTFRSHLNSGNVMQEEKSSGSKKQIVKCRPIALVKPRQLSQLNSGRHEVSQGIEQSNFEAVYESNEINKPANKLNFNKRNFRLQLSKRAGMSKIPHKSMQQCACGKYLVVRSSKKSCVKTSAQTTLKCRKCRELSRSRASYLRSIVQVEKELSFLNEQNIVLETVTDETNESQSINQQQQQQATPPPPPSQQLRHNYVPKPTIDGKVVSMLRRLGTTLSREPQENGREYTTTNNTLPQIMSPPKPKSKWLRPLDDDEILINFNANISEVLPSLSDQFTTHNNTLTARKRLTFQVSETSEVIDLCEENDNNSSKVAHLMATDSKPENFINTLNMNRGLTITLV